MIKSASKKSNHTLAYLAIVFGSVLFFGLLTIPNRISFVSFFIFFCGCSVVFFLPAMIILYGKKELTIKNNTLTINSNISPDIKFSLSEMVKWKSEFVPVRYTMSHRAVLIMKPNRKVISIRESDFEQFDIILKYFEKRFRHKLVKDWRDKV